jgi:hypothetical protein
MSKMNHITFRNALRDLKDLINNDKDLINNDSDKIQNLIEMRDLCKYISEYLSEDITIKQRNINAKNK